MRLWLCALVLLAGCAQPMRIIEGWAASSRPTYNKHQIDATALCKGVLSWTDYSTVLFNHDDNHPIGRILALEFREEKAWVKIAISQDETALWRKIQEGILTGLSICIIPLEEEMAWFDELDTDGTTVTRIVIIEISVVSIPANPDCRILKWYFEAKVAER